MADPVRVGSLACLADVHGNTAALEAVLASPEFDRAEAVAFLGCTTTGPDPLGVLELCHAIDKPTLFIAGNGERAVLEVADGISDDWPTGRWLADQHGAAGLAEIRGWPATIGCDVAGIGAVRLCHGSPRSDIELLTPETSEERIAQATSGVDEATIAHGHTHLQYERRVAGRRLIGPGSVGLPYTAGPFGARWALLGPGIDLITTPYEFEDARERIVAIGYPDERYLTRLRTPPTPAEIIADAETLQFSD